MKNRLLITALGVAIFTGCATTSLQTQTKTTQTIFLDPVKKSERLVFVSVKNTSGQNIGDLSGQIEAKIIQKGYKITDDPESAKYVLMVNVLFANNLKEANAAKAGADGAALGATAGRIGDADGAGGKLNSNQVDNKSQIYDTNYVEHKTRVFSEAVKMNLNLQEAMPILTTNMAEQISGIF